MVFLQGGPGGATLSGLRRWLRHPLRKDFDIVLPDLRGTGLSEPVLCPELGKDFLHLQGEDLRPEAEMLARKKAAP